MPQNYIDVPLTAKQRATFEDVPLAPEPQDDRTWQNKAADTVVDLGIGALKGVGTTAAGLRAMESQLSHAVYEAADAALERTRELAKG